MKYALMEIINFIVDITLQAPINPRQWIPEVVIYIWEIILIEILK